MSILSRFSENERDDHRDQSRQEALRVQRSIQHMLDEARVATETARANEQASREREQAERQAKEAALAEIARLKALLQQQKDG